MKRWVYLRIRDNVLDLDDWTILCLVIDHEKVVECHAVRKGAYAFRCFPDVGATLLDLCRWCAYQPREDAHPACYHEAYTHDLKWEHVGAMVPTHERPAGGLLS